MAQEKVIKTGWIKTIRKSKRYAFIEVHEGTQMKSIQCILESEHPQFDEVTHLTIGSTICVEGVIQAHPKDPKAFEIHIEEISILHLCDKSYPIQKKKHSLEYLRTIPHLRARTQTFYSVFKIKHILIEGMHTFLSKEGFTYIQTPMITKMDGEGAGELFTITTLGKIHENEDYKRDIFKEQTYLNVTGQLHLEPFIQAFRKVYTFGPSFRAEKSNTSRHVTEFWQVEPEMAFVDFEELLIIIEKMCKFMMQYVLEKCVEELEYLEKEQSEALITKLEKTLKESFGVIKYQEAIKYLSEIEYEFEVEPSDDTGLLSEHERYLTDIYFKKPVFVTHYPKNKKAFYMKQHEDGKSVYATDLLFPKVGEVVGGSEREENYDILIKRMEELKMDLSLYSGYLETRKYGSVVHSGFGIGIERLVRYITGMDNIRDVIAYPRTPGTIIW